MKFLFPFFFLFLNTIVYGTEIFLSCANGPHQRIRVIRFEDEFSRKPIVLIDTVFDESGKVSFEIGCSDVCPIEIRTESCFGKWFLEPDRSYNLGFMIPDSSFSLSENNVPEIVISNLNQQTNCLADLMQFKTFSKNQTHRFLFNHVYWQKNWKSLSGKLQLIFWATPPAFYRFIFSI